MSRFLFFFLLGAAALLANDAEKKASQMRPEDLKSFTMPRFNDAKIKEELESWKKKGENLNQQYGHLRQGDEKKLPAPQEEDPKKRERWQNHMQSAQGEFTEVSTNNVDGKKSEKLNSLGSAAQLEGQPFNHDFSTSHSLDPGTLKNLHNSDFATQNAAEILSGQPPIVSQESFTHSHLMACQQARPKETIYTQQNLLNQEVWITPEVVEFSWTKSWEEERHHPTWKKVFTFGIMQTYKERVWHTFKSHEKPHDVPEHEITRTLISPRRADVGPDQWEYKDEELKRRKGRGENCDLISSQCVDKKDRWIEGERINRPCWRWEYTYHCFFPVKTDCSNQVFNGCRTSSESCRAWFDSKCYVFERTLSCTKNTGTRPKTDLAGMSEWQPLKGEPNNEFHEALSKLSVLKEAAQKGTISATNLFPGHRNTCGKTAASAITSDCCAVSGWGLIVSCNEEEKNLYAKRQKGFCHEVGGRCTHWFLNKWCTHDITTFCCFDGKLQRIVHEQGRAQIGKGWGNVDYPDCSGFSESEIGRLDFSQMNFGEYFADIEGKYKPQNLENMTNQVKDRFKSIQSNPGTQKERKEL